MQKDWVIDENQEPPTALGAFLFHPGHSQTKRLMASFNKLNYDDYMEIKASMRFESVTYAQKNNNNNLDKLNAFFLQFIPEMDLMAMSNKSHDQLPLSGFTIALVNHNSHNYSKANRQTYFLTYKFFPSEITMGREYLMHLFEDMDMGKEQTCEFEYLDQVVDFRILIDYEDTDTLAFSFKPQNDKNAEWNECFKVKNISKYITKTQSFIQMQQITGFKHTLKTEIHKFSVAEKRHRLEVDRNLHVSHDLVEEIFDKVKNFGAILAEDKESMQDIQVAQANLVKKAQLLRVYSEDLKNGSRKLQEFMLQSLNKHRMVNPANMAKMTVIKEKLKNLSAYQENVYTRYIDIKQELSSHNIIKMTHEQFKRIDNLLERITTEVSSKSFVQFTKKTKKYLKVLKRADMATMIEQIKELAEGYMVVCYNDIGSTSMYIVGFLCASVIFLCFCVLRALTKGDK